MLDAHDHGPRPIPIHVNSRLIVQFAGIALIVIGAWAFTEKNRLVSDGIDSLHAKYDDVFRVVFDLTIIVLVVGLVVFVLAFVGCVGALRENICLLKCVRRPFVIYFLNYPYRIYVNNIVICKLSIGI